MSELEEIKRERDEARLLLARVAFVSERFIRRYTSRAKRESAEGQRIFAALDDAFEALTEWVGEDARNPDIDQGISIS